MKTVILSLLFAMVVQVAHAEVRIELRPIFHHYDYGYEGNMDGWYGERQTFVQTVEIRHRLPGRVIGWQYMGVIRIEELTDYETQGIDRNVWWGCRRGSNGLAESEEDAMIKIMRCSGYNAVSGKNNVFRRALFHREKSNAVETRNCQDRSVDCRGCR